MYLYTAYEWNFRYIFMHWDVFVTISDTRDGTCLVLISGHDC